MTEFDLRPPECPSELTFDQLVLGELDAEAADALRAHAASCSHCAPLLSEVEAGLGAYPQLDARRDHLVARIEHMHRQEVVLESKPTGAKAERSPRRGRARLTGHWRWGALSGVAVALLLTVGALRPTAESPATRLKGGVKLRVYRAVGETSKEVLTDEALRDGERLRFSVDVPPRGALMVVGVEASGRVFPYHPLHGRSLALTPAIVPPSGLLDAAVSLDASKGQEWIHLVWCERAFSLDALRHDSQLVTPEGCRTDGIRVRKP